MRNPYNIVSGIMTRRLLDETNKFGCAGVTQGIYTYRLRHCTIKGVRSGGVVVSVDCEQLLQHGVYLDRPTRRLRPGYSQKSLIRAVGRCMNEAELYTPLRKARERFYLAFENKKDTYTDNEIEAITEAGESAGHISAYSDMTENDINYWRNVFNLPVTDAISR